MLNTSVDVRNVILYNFVSVFQEDSLSVRLMAQKTKREMEMQKRISELEEKSQSYSVANVEAATEGVYKRDASVINEKKEILLPHHEGYSHTTTVQVAIEEGRHKRDTDKDKEKIEEEEKKKAEGEGKGGGGGGGGGGAGGGGRP